MDNTGQQRTTIRGATCISDGVFRSQTFFNATMKNFDIFFDVCNILIRFPIALFILTYDIISVASDYVWMDGFNLLMINPSALSQERGGLGCLESCILSILRRNFPSVFSTFSTRFTFAIGAGGGLQSCILSIVSRNFASVFSNKYCTLTSGTICHPCAHKDMFAATEL